MNLSLPGFDRWRNLFSVYEDSLKQQALTAQASHRPDRSATASRLGRELLAWREAQRAVDLEWTDPEAAERSFEEALAKAPDNADILGNYAIFLARRGRSKAEVQAAFERAIEADPNHPNNLSNYASAIIDLGHLDEAQRIFERALAVGPEDYRVSANYGSFLLESGRDTGRGNELLDRAAQLAGPNAARVSALWAVSLWRSSAVDDARVEALFQEALASEAEPQRVGNVAANYAQFLFAARRDEEALALVERATTTPGLAGTAAAELDFYLLAHVPSLCAEARERLQEVLRGDLRVHWSFAPDLERLRQEADPRLPLLETLAEVLNGRLQAESLSALPEQWCPQDSAGRA